MPQECKVEKALKLPEGWQKCCGRYRSIENAEYWANIWNLRQDNYYYKIFPRSISALTYIIARKPKHEIIENSV